MIVTVELLVPLGGFGGVLRGVGVTAQAACRSASSSRLKVQQVSEGSGASQSINFRIDGLVGFDKPPEKRPRSLGVELQKHDLVLRHQHQNRRHTIFRPAFCTHPHEDCDIEKFTYRGHLVGALVNSPCRRDNRQQRRLLKARQLLCRRTKRELERPFP
jgi:hypothetical protein